MSGLKKLNLPNVVCRARLDVLKTASLGWHYRIDPPSDGGAALMADIAATGWKSPVSLPSIPPTVFAEYRRDGDKVYVHLLNYSPHYLPIAA